MCPLGSMLIRRRYDYADGLLAGKVYKSEGMRH